MPNVNIKTPDWLRQMESILEELNEGVVIVDEQLRVVFANEALTRMGQYERGEIEGRTPDAIFPTTDIPYIMRQHESGQSYGRSRIEFYLPRKNGEKIPAIFSGRLIQAPGGQEYVLLIVTDISAQKRVEEQLRESNAQLEKRQMEIEAELSLAARVQQSLAPRSLVWNDLAVDAYYSPARTIGGDFGVVLPQSSPDVRHRGNLSCARVARGSTAPAQDGVFPTSRVPLPASGRSVSSTAPGLPRRVSNTAQSIPSPLPGPAAQLATPPVSAVPRASCQNYAA
jgi:PAS domain S-box-containing protein